MTTLSTSVDLQLPQLPVIADTEVRNKLARVFSAINILAQALDTYTGAGLVAIFSETVIAGDLINVYNNAGVLTARLASAADTTKPANGFAPLAVTSGHTGAIYPIGVISELSGLTPGAIYYLSDTTPGGRKSTQPTVIQPVGFALSSTTFFCNPDLTIINGSIYALLAGASTQDFSAKKFIGYDNLILPKTAGKGILVDTAAPTYNWKDLHGWLKPDTGGVGAPTLAAFRGGVVRTFFYAANDLFDQDYHIPHDWAPGTDLFIHLHWSHNGTAITGNFTVTITHTYAKGHGQANFRAEKVITLTYATVNIATTPQYVHRIDEVQLTSAGGSASLENTGVIEPDGVFSLQLKVIAIPTITGGTQNKPAILYMDLHYQSTNIGTKQKSPDFYT